MHVTTYIVGNIPFDCTEEQLIDVFKEVGPVESFRCVIIPQIRDQC